MLARSDTGAGQPVALIITRMAAVVTAAVLATIRPRRVLRAARKRERWTRKSRSRECLLVSVLSIDRHRETMDLFKEDRDATSPMESWTMESISIR